MNYIVYGSQDYVVKKLIKKLTKEMIPNGTDELNYTVLSFESNSSDELISALSGTSLLSNTRILVINDCCFLSTSKDNNNKAISYILETISNMNDELCLFLVCPCSKIDNCNKIVQIIKEKGKIVEAINFSYSDWEKYIRDKFNKTNIKITDDAIKELIYRTKSDFAQFENEFAKLKNFDNEINTEDVKHLVAEPLDENNFNILNFLIKGNIKNALKSYQDLLLTSNDPTTFISMFASQLKIYNQVLYLANTEGLSNNVISKKVGISEQRVYMTIKNGYRLNNENIAKILHELYTLDFSIKSGIVDKYIGFEKFVLNFSSYL